MDLLRRKHPKLWPEYGWVWKSGFRCTKRVISLKGGNIWPKLLLRTNRKSHMRFRSVPKSTTMTLRVIITHSSAQNVPRKLRKTLGGYFILPYPVYSCCNSWNLKAYRAMVCILLSALYYSSLHCCECFAIAGSLSAGDKERLGGLFRKCFNCELYCHAF